ncbi:MAG: hypothetical protein WD467_00750 [Candidatus Saccharimonadales bacterium]
MYYQQALVQSRASRQRRVGRNSQLGGYRASQHLGPVTSTLFLAIIIGVLALLYLTQITKTSVYGYEINELSQQQATLIEEQQELQVEAARLQSVARIESASATAGLVPEANVSYDR